jgi:hypothetical protein
MCLCRVATAYAEQPVDLGLREAIGSAVPEWSDWHFSCLHGAPNGGVADAEERGLFGQGIHHTLSWPLGPGCVVDRLTPVELSEQNYGPWLLLPIIYQI